MNSSNLLFSTCALTILISLQVFSTLSGAELPAPLRTLVERRQEAISRIDKIFIQELEKIKVNYTKAGDLEKAILIEELIGQTKRNDSNELLDKNYLSIKYKLVGKWMIYDTGSPNAWSGLITITKDLNYSCQGTFGTTDNKGSAGRAIIKNSNVIIGPYNFDASSISTGKIFTGIDRTMERIK